MTKQKMTNQLLCFLLTFITCMRFAVPLSCYSCQGDDCDDKAKWRNITGCGEGNFNENKTGVCVDKVYTEGNSTRKHTFKDCKFVPVISGKPAFDCSDQDIKVTKCQLCTTDYCNSASEMMTMNLMLYITMFFTAVYKHRNIFLI